MARILITSGPTRQYLDPVRYLTNASSGRMGQALAQAAQAKGHDLVIVSGPVEVEYPAGATVVPVTSTEEMLEASRREFASCDGLIGVAAPCDYRPVRVAKEKISKTGDPLVIHLIETPDVVASLAAEKCAGQWIVGFALETTDIRFRALAKMQRKSCDLMVLNGPQAMNSMDNAVEVMLPTCDIVGAFSGDKPQVAVGIFEVIERYLLASSPPCAKGDRFDPH